MGRERESYKSEEERLGDLENRRNALLFYRGTDGHHFDDKETIEGLQTEIAKIRESQGEKNDNIPAVIILLPGDISESRGGTVEKNKDEQIKFNDHMQARVEELEEQYAQADPETQSRLKIEIGLLKNLAGDFGDDSVSGSVLFDASKTLSFNPWEYKKMMRDIILSISDYADKFQYENPDWLKWRIVQAIKSFNDGKSWLEVLSDKEKYRTEYNNLLADDKYGKNTNQLLNEYKREIFKQILYKDNSKAKIGLIVNDLQAREKLKPSLFMRSCQEILKL